MKRIAAFFVRLFSALGHSIRRYPAALSLCAALTALALVQLHGDFTQTVNESLTCWMMTLALGVLTALCIQAASEVWNLSWPVRTAAYIAAGGLLVLYRFYLVTADNMVSGVRLVALIAALVLVFLALPFIYRRNEKPTEIFTIRLAYRALITGVYTGVIIGGISAILLAMDKLLGVKLPDNIYEDVSILVGGLFAPTFFLAGVPAQDDDLPVEKYPSFIRVLFLYVLIPLLGAYTLVLYIYFIKMLMTLSWPVGMLGNMVFWYSMIAVGVLFLLWPLRDRSPWAKAYCVWYPRIGILPLIMMFISMAIRIEAYGITENRYFVWIMGMWLLAALIVRVVRRQGANLWMPLTLALVAFLTVMGPWNAFSVSRFSQNTRLDALLEQNNMIVAGEVVPAGDNISDEDKRQINEILQYFDERHDLSMVDALPSDFSTSDAKKVLGFEYVDYYPIYRAEDDYRYLYRESQYGSLMDISGYDYYYTGNYKELDSEQTQDGISVSYDPDTQGFLILNGSDTLMEINIENQALTILNNQSDGEMMTDEAMTFINENDRVRVQITYDSLEFQGNQLQWAAFTALIDMK